MKENPFEENAANFMNTNEIFKCELILLLLIWNMWAEKI